MPSLPSFRPTRLKSVPFVSATSRIPLPALDSGACTASFQRAQRTPFPSNSLMPVSEKKRCEPSGNRRLRLHSLDLLNDVNLVQSATLSPHHVVVSIADQSTKCRVFYRIGPGRPQRVCLTNIGYWCTLHAGSPRAAVCGACPQLSGIVRLGEKVAVGTCGTK